MKDFVKSKKGTMIFKRTKLIHLFAIITERLKAAAAKKGLNLKSSTRRKTKQEAIIEGCLDVLQKSIDNEKEIEELANVDMVAYRAKLKMEEEKLSKLSEATMFPEEWKWGTNYAKKGDMEEATKRVSYMMTTYIMKNKYLYMVYFSI